MSRKRTKQYLMLLMVIGLVSIAAGGGGTFASFTAETANGGNTFATGSLYLHDKVQGNSNTCTSESSATNSNVDPNSNGVYPGDHCDYLFNFVTGASAGPQHVGLTLSNAGTLNASGLTIASNDPGCQESVVYESNTTLSQAATAGDTTLHVNAVTLAIRSGATIQITDGTQTETKTVGPAVPVDATTITLTSGLTNSYTVSSPTTHINTNPSFSGGSGLCNNLEMTITESASPTFADVTVDPTTGDTSGGLGCAYGTANLSGGCTMSATPNIGSIPLYSGTPDPLTLADLSGSTDPITATGLDSKTPRYFVITIYPNVVNGDQGKKATFDLVWHMDQA